MHAHIHMHILNGIRKELRCVIGIIRHGDRTPKQKMKMVVTDQRFIKLFEQLNGPKTGHIKIKEPKLLQVIRKWTD